jgi:hypothetical protein
MKRISITIAAVALGAAFASGAAFAQQAQPHYGKSANDGGLTEANGSAPKGLYNSATPAAVHYGKGLNDGGIVDTPDAKAMAAAKSIKSVQNAPHYGKALNDGGM